MADSANSSGASRAAFRHRNFWLFQTARSSMVLAMEMQSVAVGWQVYEITKRPLDLGFVGLVQFLPGILLFLVSGHAADRYDRRKLIIVCYIGYGLSFALLLAAALRHSPAVVFIFVILALLGTVRAFNAPVSRALLPQLVPEEDLPNAITWASTFFQASSILGPAAGGVVYAAFRGPAAVYATSVALTILALVCAIKLKTERSHANENPSA